MTGTLGDMIGGQAGSDRGEYLAYAEACMMAGRSPLPYPQWVAAGKPAK